MSKVSETRQREAQFNELVKAGYDPESIIRWQDFWDKPLMKSAYYDRDGLIIGYIDPVKGKVEDRSGELNKKYAEELNKEPRLTL